MKKNIITFQLLLFLSLTFAFGQNARQFHKVGEEFYENGKYQDAIEQLTRAIEIDPDYEKAYELRAIAYETVKNFRLAREDYEKLSIFDDKNEEYYYNGARMSYEMGDYKDAVKKLNLALENKGIFLEALQLKVLALIELEDYKEALEVSKEALKLKETEVNFFHYARITGKLGMLNVAEEAYEDAIRKNRNFYEAYTNLAELQRKRNRHLDALENVNKALSMNKNFLPAYEVRSTIYADQMNYSAAINDVSTILLREPKNAKMYFLRGKYYQDYAQHGNAISDFTRVISLDPGNIQAYYNRAYSYEQVQRFDDAIKDYQKLGKIADNDEEALALMEQAGQRLYELNRENNQPEVTLLTPREQDGQVVQIPTKENVVALVGQIEDESEIQEVLVNEVSVPFTKKEEYTEFLSSVNIQGKDELRIEVVDAYNNRLVVDYEIMRTEVTPPAVKILAPYASDNNIIWLETDEPVIYIEGEIADESLIKSIYIDDVLASYVPNDKNPSFQAMINIQNKNQFKVKATDSYGNTSETVFMLNRESANIQDETPMGKTWVVFIENSNYETFASLEGPENDIRDMKGALSDYVIHNSIHKKDMNKQEMEKFFAIELRDLVRSNQVNSLLVWFAGHGKFVNQTGYWVPVDAKRDEEFTFYNINALKASMQSYPEFLDHTLIVTDACESGPSFYQAMRSELNENKSCNDPIQMRLKSSQVFSSAGYELALDNSEFTRTFAGVLENNNDKSCLPIEFIVPIVKRAVINNKQQEPQFGKISGLEDQNGTFFFIKK